MEEYNEVTTTFEENVSANNVEEHDNGTSGIDARLLGIGAAAIVAAGGVAWAKREAIKERVRNRRAASQKKKAERLAKKAAEINAKLNNEAPKEESATE